MNLSENTVPVAHNPYNTDDLRITEIKEVIAKSRELGMQTFDQSLFELYESGQISYEDALRNADSVNDIRLKIKLEGKEARDKDLSAGLDHLGIV